ncbi:MAG TPA: class I SAM-dependent methyltransferase [Actinophytocola sp.]|uniref:class I SAM-dependent methyltransferase n=1 Tax=Actinophytocola sp. TaxID=1872138 RepID=UPI002DB882BD|nr:class I SAM-dependent methyltransferase [Actinophytocola sp.]HEU5470956.1 class I SAM-dependent methyltransferase [Actinophytocola sp.]
MRRAAVHRYSATGTGPGHITDDGCPVDLYALLPATGEADVVHSAIPAGATILELGAGAGRITRGLLAHGHRVVAVDHSARMLAHIPGTPTMCAPIESLAIDERFAAVLLASYLVNETDDTLRAAWLATCVRHLAPGGALILQRHTPSWFDRAEPYERVERGITFRLRRVSRPAPHLLEATMEYEHDGRRWTHSYVHRRMDDDDIAAALAGAGLRLDSFLTEDRAWILARR